MSNFKPRLNEWLSPLYCTPEELWHRVNKAEAFVARAGGKAVIVNIVPVIREGVDAAKELHRRGITPELNTII